MEGALTLEGAAGDDDHADIFRTILNTIATESHMEIQREMEMISEIQTCKRKPSEKADVFETGIRLASNVL